MMEDLFQRRLVLLSIEGNDLAETGVLPMITMMLLRMQPQTLQQVVEVITHHHGLVNRNVGFAHLRKRIKESCVEFPACTLHCQQTCMTIDHIGTITVPGLPLCPALSTMDTLKKTRRQLLRESGERVSKGPRGRMKGLKAVGW